MHKNVNAVLYIFVRTSTPIMRVHLTFLIGFYLLLPNARATHLAGATIKYEYVADSVYDFYFHYYRNCNGVSFENPSSATKINCISGCSAKTLSLSLVSITYVRELCNKASNPCYPANTYATGKGIEEHIYKVRIDFRDSAFQYLYGGGDLIVETGQCCRTSDITTGAANSYFYIYTIFNPAKTPKNSSPKFKEHPLKTICCNQATNLNLEAVDKDGDSLSYKAVTPLTAYGKNANYSSAFSANKPLPVYDPNGKGLINPDASPPLGYYVSTTDGQIIFTPVKCDAVTPISIEVTEWRKDTTGTYQKIGVVLREIVIDVAVCPDNHNPTIAGPYNYYVCEGDSISFTIKTADKVYVPPPPLPKPDPDTVSISWNNGIQGGTFTVVSDTALHQSAVFSWRPPKGSGSSLPYSFIVRATDNHCTRPGMTYRGFKIYVGKELKGYRTLNQVSCGLYDLTARYDTSVSTAVHWQLYDSGWKLLTDSLSASFLSNNGTASDQWKDQLRIYKSGKYFLKMQASTGSCSKTIIDSLFTHGYFDLIKPKDSTLCSGQVLTLRLDSTINGWISAKKWIFNGSTQVADTFKGILTKGRSKLLLEAKGKDGCTRFDTISIATKYIPDLIDLSDTTLCFSDQPAISAVDLLDSGLVTNKVLWSTADTGQILHRALKTGWHWVQMQNECGSDIDSFYVQVDTIHQPELGPDSIICNQASYALSDLKAVPDLIYYWSTGDSSTAITVQKSGSYKVTATNTCSVLSDSVELTFLKTPVVNLGNDLKLGMPFFRVLDGGSMQGMYKWSTGDTTKTITVGDYGTYWLEVSNACGKHRDSITISWPVGVNEFKSTPLNLFPNPTYGAFAIKSVEMPSVEFHVWDEVGRAVAFKQRYVDGAYILEIAECVSGIYFIEMEEDGLLRRGRVLVLK